MWYKLPVSIQGRVQVEKRNELVSFGGSLKKERKGERYKTEDKE